MFKQSVAAILCLTLISISACSSYSNKSPMPSVSEEAQMRLNAPIDCNHAQADIDTLKEERASVGKQALSGIRSVLPVAVVAGLLMGDYSDRVSVATGQYNSDIEAKIKEIEGACGVY